MIFNNRCKICHSGLSSDLEFCRFYLRWDYPLLIETYRDDIDNLNEYNLSTHFNRHVRVEVRKLFQSLRLNENSEKDKEFIGKDKDLIHRAANLIHREHGLGN